MSALSISVIIPVLNEENILPSLLTYLRSIPSQEYLIEIIIVDGGSTDKSIEIANQQNATVVRSPKGRARQMNVGAKAAKGNILYFLHADSHPPQDIWFLIAATTDRNVDAGCLRLKFDTNSWFLKANAWFTRLNINAIRFGDQSLFVKREVFEAVGGFDESHVVLEDQEIVKRISRKFTFKVLPAYVTTSDRKYKENGNLRLQSIFFLICILYNLGASQNRLVRVYKKLVRKPNI
jgi:rSAM/selenodomain-associated transferase 2